MGRLSTDALIVLRLAYNWLSSF